MEGYENGKADPLLNRAAKLLLRGFPFLSGFKASLEAERAPLCPLLDRQIGEAFLHLSRPRGPLRVDALRIGML